MADRLEEIERRLRSAEPENPQHSYDADYCRIAPYDVALLLGEVRRLRARTHELSERADMSRKAIASNVEACRAEGVSLGRILANASAHDAEIERDEARSLALSLADALSAVSVHSPGCTHGWAEETRHKAKMALSDPGLAKLRQKE